MKSIKNQTIFLVVILFLFNICHINSKNVGKSEATPKANDLKNAFGAPTKMNNYGPQTNQYSQYIEANPDTFMPFKFDGNKKIESQMKQNENFIKSGDMTNIAPSANSIINPEISKPKLNINADVIYPVEVHVPTLKGINKVFHNVSAYNKETGQIVHDRVLVSKPEYTLEKHVNKHIKNF